MTHYINSYEPTLIFPICWNISLFPPSLHRALLRELAGGDCRGMLPGRALGGPARVGAGSESIAGFNAGIMTAARADSRPFDFHGDGATPAAAQGENSSGGSQRSGLVGVDAEVDRPSPTHPPKRLMPELPLAGREGPGAVGIPWAREAAGPRGPCGRAGGAGSDGCSWTPPGGRLPNLPSPDTDLVPPHAPVPISLPPAQKLSRKLCPPSCN